MTRYGRSPWIDRVPKSRVPAYPKHKGALTTGVIVVGGGLTGCATAYAFAAAGVKVVLLEADRLAQGGSGGTFGWISESPGPGYRALEQAVGGRAARRAWQAWRRGALDFAALLRRLPVTCGLEPASTLRVARTPEQAALLARELKARRDAGLDGAAVNARTVQSECGLDAVSAFRTRDGATIDPYRAALGLAAAAAARGAIVFERTAAVRLRFSEKAVDVETAGGTIRGDRVVVATGRPTPLVKALIRHFWFEAAYLVLTEPVPAKVRKAMGAHDPGRLVVVDSADPAHHLRRVDDGRVLVAGAIGPAVADRLREKTLVQRTGQLMYELSTLYPDLSGLAPAAGWDSPFGRTADGLPYIGPHRNFPRHLFAFGCGGHSVTDAFLASRILLRHHLDACEPGDDVFGFTTGRL